MRTTWRTLVVALLGLVALSCSSAKQVEVIEGLDYYGSYPASQTEIMAVSDVIALVRFRSVEAVGVHSPHTRWPDHIGGPEIDRGYHPALDVTFDVIEYLKGTGGTTLKALIYKYHNPLYINMTQAQAQEKARGLLGLRDKRWDDRDALVFLRLDEPTGRLYLGQLASPFINVTVSSGQYKAWLPAVSTTTASAAPAKGARGSESKSTVDPVFYLDDPGDSPAPVQSTALAAKGTAAARAATSTIPTITLSAVKREIAKIQRWVQDSGGTAEAENCVQTAYSMRRSLGQRPREVVMHTFTAASGQPAGSDALRYVPDEVDASEATAPSWREGPDAHLFGNRPGYSTFARPLPAGEYRFFLNWRDPLWLVCDFYDERLRNKYEYHVTVTAPAGTLAESFFDPYASSTAVVGTTTVGTISWQSGEVTADLTRSVTGHALDFIDLKGTTTLSLPVSNATTTGAGALVWAVSKQPWKAGDKLMLRVRKADASTPTPTPTATPTPTPTPIPTPTATPTPTPTATATPTPTSMPAPKPTATPTPTGKLTIGSTSIVKGGSTKVTAHGVTPSNLLVRISTSHHLTLTGSCDGYGIFGAGGVAPFTSTLTACNVGRATVKLVTIGSGAVLATLQVEVLPSNSGGKR